VIVYSARARLVTLALWNHRAGDFIAHGAWWSNTRSTTSNISVTTCEMVAVFHQWPCWQHFACCSVNSRHIGSKLRFLPTPSAFDASVRGVSIWILPWRLVRKTRMAWLPDGENFLKICLFVLTQLTNVTDTDTVWRYRPCLCITSHGKNYMHIQLSLFLHFYLLYLLWNSGDWNYTKQPIFLGRLLAATTRLNTLRNPLK